MYLFVYGTLKRGFCNHYLLEEYAEFISNATTQNRYPMVTLQEDFFPYLINNKGIGEHIEGELYRIDGNLLDILDVLEDCPRLYIREEVIVISMGVPLSAIVYFAKRTIDYRDTEFLKCFE
jgi:gamma-glutamylaminecyclotransferase